MNDRTPLQHAEDAAAHAQKAARYADLAVKWLIASLTCQGIGAILLILSIIARHLGW